MRELTNTQLSSFPFPSTLFPVHQSAPEEKPCFCGGYFPPYQTAPSASPPGCTTPLGTQPPVEISTARCVPTSSLMILYSYSTVQHYSLCPVPVPFPFPPLSLSLSLSLTRRVVVSLASKKGRTVDDRKTTTILSLPPSFFYLDVFTHWRSSFSPITFPLDSRPSPDRLSSSPLPLSISHSLQSFPLLDPADPPFPFHGSSPLRPGLASLASGPLAIYLHLPRFPFAHATHSGRTSACSSIFSPFLPHPIFPPSTHLISFFFSPAEVR